MKKLLSLAIATLMLICAIPTFAISVTAAEGVILSTSESADYNNLNDAIKNTPDGGTITIKGTYKMPKSFSWTAQNKTVIITGGTFDTTELSILNIKSGVIFKNTNLKWSGTVYANGNPLTVDSNVTVSGTLSSLYGGGNGTTVDNTSLTILSGSYTNIYGGSKNGTVNGDTYVYVGGQTNPSCDTTNHDKNNVIYGGGNGDTVKGNTHVIFGENAKISFIYGGSYNSGSTIGGTAYVDVTGGDVFSVYGAGRNVDCVSNTITTITGGTFHQIFGGSEESNVTGNVTLRVLGGTITRRIYGGCYNEATRDGFSMVWKSANCVSGNIKLIMGGDATVTFSASDNDRAVYARTRHKDKIDGNAQIYYLDSSAKQEGHDSTDKVSEFFIPISTSTLLDIDKADKTHKYLTHSSSGNTITESCSCGCGHSATATLKLREGASLVHTGSPIEPMLVEYSENWLCEDLGDIKYSNNIDYGKATAEATLVRKNLTATATFDIKPSENDYFIGIANGTLSGPLSLTKDISLAECDAQMLLRIANATDKGEISFDGYKLKGLSVEISSKEELSAIRDYCEGSFTLTSDIDLDGVCLTSPIFTLKNSTLTGKHHTIHNYSVIDCGLAAIEGDVSVSDLNLGYADSPINVTSDTITAAPFTAKIGESTSLSVKNMNIFVEGDGTLGFGGIAGRSEGELITEDVTFAGNGGSPLMLARDGLRLVDGTPVVCGIQKGMTETVNIDGVQTEVFSLRFIASINNTLDYKRLGLSVRIGDGEAENINISYVYTSLLETTSSGEQRQVNAEELGGSYLYAVILSGIPTNGVNPDGSVSFTVTPYATDNAENEYTGMTVRATFVNGEYVEEF